MSDNIKHIFDANAEFTKENKGNPDLPDAPKRRLAVLTCMDARLDLIKFLGLEPGDAHIIRNVGGQSKR